MSYIIAEFTENVGSASMIFIVEDSDMCYIVFI